MNLLAIETSTEVMSLAVQAGAVRCSLDAPGGAQSSGSLIAAVMDLMREAGLGFEQLDAIVWGQGPGSFTGVRTACAVAQGLAFAHGTPVLEVPTLAACAQMAMQARPAHRGPVAVAMDARMGEIYFAVYEPQAWHQGGAAPVSVSKPTDCHVPAHALLCGNASPIYPGLAAQPGVDIFVCLPGATQLLDLAPLLLAQGLATPACEAHPLYIRNKVAQTTAEREMARLG